MHCHRNSWNVFFYVYLSHVRVGVTNHGGPISSAPQKTAARKCGAGFTKSVCTDDAADRISEHRAAYGAAPRLGNYGDSTEIATGLP